MTRLVRIVLTQILSPTIADRLVPKLNLNLKRTLGVADEDGVPESISAAPEIVVLNRMSRYRDVLTPSPSFSVIR